ncbi:MAG: hypothetical protein ACLRX6_03725 [Limosilactobacillus pontis]|nr:hypothetical protein [Limosilactobacillus pontis]
MSLFEKPHCGKCGYVLDDFAVAFGNYCPKCGNILGQPGGIRWY